MRKLGRLRGLAILLVVLGHSPLFAVSALAWWGQRFGSTASVPDWTWVGTPTYYGLLGIHELALVSVPLFLFASGFYIAYAARGNQSNLNWSFIRGSLNSLLPPFLIWIGLSVLVTFLPVYLGPSGSAETLPDFIWRRMTEYYYILLLAQLLLLSPVLTWLALRHPVGLLVGAGMVEAIEVGLRYASLAPANATNSNLLTAVLHSSWEPMVVWKWAFFFPLGLVVALHYEAVVTTLVRLRWLLIAGVVLAAMASVVEVAALNRVELSYDNSFDWKASSFIYAVAGLLLAISLEWRWRFLGSWLDRLGTQSYGIYLIQPIAAEVLSKIVYHVAPGLLARPFAFVVVLFVVGLGVPLLLMAAVARSPLRRYHYQLFGNHPATRKSGQAKRSPPRVRVAASTPSTES